VAQVEKLVESHKSTQVMEVVRDSGATVTAEDERSHDADIRSAIQVLKSNVVAQQGVRASVVRCVAALFAAFSSN
jgi:hypothetical protein